MNIRAASPPFPVARRINGERVVVLGWGRAMLMQFAHPLVAAGVHDHSTFRHGRLARFRRLHDTVQSMLGLTFGDETEAARVAARINRIHDRVRGRLPEDAGILPAGTPYSAHDPALLLWVHATLLDTLPLAYERFVGPLTIAERDAYVEEAAAGAARLGLHDDSVPRCLADLHRYVDRTVLSGVLKVSAVARALAMEVLHPPFAWAGGPASSLHRLFSVGTLPPALRESYGFVWTNDDERRLHRLTRRVRRLRALAPGLLARFRKARRP